MTPKISKTTFEAKIRSRSNFEKMLGRSAERKPNLKYIDRNGSPIVQCVGIAIELIVFMEKRVMLLRIFEGR